MISIQIAHAHLLSEIAVLSCFHCDGLLNELEIVSVRYITVALVCQHEDSYYLKQGRKREFQLVSVANLHIENALASSVEVYFFLAHLKLFHQLLSSVCKNGLQT